MQGVWAAPPSPLGPVSGLAVGWPPLSPVRLHPARHHAAGLNRGADRRGRAVQRSPMTGVDDEMRRDRRPVRAGAIRGNNLTKICFAVRKVRVAAPLNIAIWRMKAALDPKKSASGSG